MQNLKRAFKTYNNQTNTRIMMCDLAKKATQVLKELHTRHAIMFGEAATKTLTALLPKKKISSIFKQTSNANRS
jgi:hypothetical protein